MSDADPEAVTVSSDGIAVRKTVDTEQFQTPAVVIELTSERDDAVMVTLVDEVPADVSMDDVGFHPDYGSEFWSVEDHRVTFERELQPGESYTTVYGVRAYPTDEVDRLLEAPDVGVGDDGPGRLDDVVDEGRSDVVRDFIAGEAPLPGLDRASVADAAEAATVNDGAAGETASAEDDGEAVEPPSEPVEGTEPAVADAPDAIESGDESASPAADATAEPAGTEATAGSAEPDADASAGEPEPVATADEGERRDVRVPLTGGVVRVLVKELREGDLDPEDRRMLRDELVGTEGSTAARIGHLQQRVSDLEAYAGALEAFIDEEGTAEAVIDGLRDDVAAVERRITGVDDRLDLVAENLEGVVDRLESVENDLGSVKNRTGLLDDRLEDAEDDLATADDRLDGFGVRLDRVSTDVDGVDDRVSDAVDRLDDLRGSLDRLEADLRADVEAVSADLEDFASFRQRLSSVFGGEGGLDASDDA